MDVPRFGVGGEVGWSDHEEIWHWMAEPVALMVVEVGDDDVLRALVDLW